MNFEREFTSEFVINNLPADQRELLLLKNTRNSICDAADVTISVRGRIIQPRSDGTLICDGNIKPLYLLIVAKSKHNLTQAMKKIQEILQNQSGSRNLNEDSIDDVLEEKITVGIDVWPIQFRMRSNILGENDEFVKYIEKETGAHITLRGKGSNYAHDNKSEEPLHIHVMYDDPTKRKRTHELVINLIETVQKDFLEKYSKYYAHPKKIEIIPIRTNNKDVWKPFSSEKPVSSEQSRLAEQSKMKDMEKIFVGFDYSPRNFDLKSKICGPNYSHFEHIENEGQVVLLLRGRGCHSPQEDDVDEPPHLLVEYINASLKSRARDLILNLLETVQNEFIQLFGTYPISPQKPRIVPHSSKIPEIKRNLDQPSSISHEPVLTGRSREPASTIPHDTRMPEIERKGPDFAAPISFETSDRRKGREPPVTSFDEGILGNQRRNREPPLSTSYNKRIPVIGRTSWEPPASAPFDKEASSLRSPELRVPLSFDRDTRKRSQEPPSPVYFDEGVSKIRRVTRESPPFVPHNKGTFDIRRSRSREPPTFIPHNKVRRRSRNRGSPIPISYDNEVRRRSRSRGPHASPKRNSNHLRRDKISPTSARHSTSHRERSKSPVIPPPPPVISRTFPFNSRDTVHPVPPVIPLTTNFTQSKPLSPPTPRKEERIILEEEDRVRNYQQPTLLNQWDQPIQNFKSPEFYLLQSQQKGNFVSSFTVQPNNGRDQYIKKVSNSTESNTRNEYPENKMYSNASFSNSLKTSPSTLPTQQKIYGGKNQPFTPSAAENHFRRNEGVAAVRNIPLVNDTFNGYNFGLGKLNRQTSVSTNNKDRLIITGQKKDEHTLKFQTTLSESEDSKSVICIDSEEEDCYPVENPMSTTLGRKPMMYSIQVQTEDEDIILKNCKIKCRCGNFVPSLTGVRSRAVQTDPERYCRF